MKKKFKKAKRITLDNFEAKDQLRNQSYTILQDSKPQQKTKSAENRIVSKGEIRIKQVLTKLGVKYSREKTFNSCKNPKTNQLLRFDFYLPDYKTLIEYDGLQHRQRMKGQTSQDLVNQIARDKIKDKWCLAKGYKLIRIPSSEYNNIETLLVYLLTTNLVK